MSDELAKAKELVSKGQCDVYILMTNAGGDLLMRLPKLTSGRVHMALKVTKCRSCLMYY
jgi:hypothetical protein